MTSGYAHIAAINSYTYRGYRYDSEIGMYYLNSRYYNPEIGRFINSDGLLGLEGDILTTNMYAYAVNNPIMNIDPSGYIGFLGIFAGITPIGWVAIAVVIVVVVILTLNNSSDSVIDNPFGNTIDNINNNIAEIKNKVAGTIVTALVAAVHSTIDNDKNTRYWSASLSKGGPIIGTRLTYSEAVAHVSMGKDVFTRLKKDAEKVAYAAGGNATPMWHSGYGRLGYYDHYHINGHRNRAHVWYLY